MQFTQIKETCLYISDIDLSISFYHDLLGLPIISRVPSRHVFFRAGNSVLLCFLPEATKHEEVLPPHFAYGKQHIAFEVEMQFYEKVKSDFIAQGITITHEQSWHNDFKSFYFNDPDGHVLEIVPSGMWD